MTPNPKIVIENERWQPIEGFPAYWISDHGRVWSDHVGRIRRQNKDSNGYYRIGLQSPNVGFKSVSVHRLVAEHFIPNLYGDPEVNHLDGNKGKNHFSNLEWCTRAENMNHAFVTGLAARKKGITPTELEECDAWMMR